MRHLCFSNNACKWFGNYLEDRTQQLDLVSLNVWYCQNELTINGNKTTIMYFGSKNIIKRNQGADVYLGGSEMTKVDCYIYLGITLESPLNYEL